MKKFFSLWALLGVILVFAQQKNLERKWMVTQMPGFSRSTLIDKKVFVDLHQDEQGRYNASAGCNSIWMKASFRPHRRLQFSGIASTMMACQDKGLEFKFTQNLEKTYRYTLQGHHLSLYNRKGQLLMRLIAEDWD